MTSAVTLAAVVLLWDKQAGYNGCFSPDVMALTRRILQVPNKVSCEDIDTYHALVAKDLRKLLTVKAEEKRTDRPIVTVEEKDFIYSLFGQEVS